MKTKVCSKCKCEKPLDQFYVRLGAPGGVRADCKQCGDNRRRAYQAAHPGVAAKRTAEWRRKNPARAAAASAKWRKEHPEKIAGYQSAWYLKNKTREGFVTGKWARDNPELARAAATAYRKANLAKYSAHSLRWVKAHPAQDAARAADEETWGTPGRVAGWLPGRGVPRWLAIGNVAASQGGRKDDNDSY